MNRLHLCKMSDKNIIEISGIKYGIAAMTPKESFDSKAMTGIQYKRIVYVAKCN